MPRRARLAAAAPALALVLLSPAASARITAAELAVVANSADPASLALARHYAARRGIAPNHIVAVDLGSPVDMLAPERFRAAFARMTEALPPSVQGLALAFTRPWRVGCMSVTSAFAFGYDERYCASGCRPTAASPYFDRDGDQPYAAFGLRPAMALAGYTVDEVHELIDRGLAADGTDPAGTVYLVRTSDERRSVRANGYARAQGTLAERLAIRIVDTDALIDRFDVLGYFTGLTRVSGLATLAFQPGAVADHLTSLGGQLTRSQQMSALAWLRAGATGSYGTVVEPCNLPAKFPDPEVLLRHYVAGDSLLEAYWKSVRQPGQGVFVGEPLAHPFRYRLRPPPRR